MRRENEAGCVAPDAFVRGGQWQCETADFEVAARLSIYTTPAAECVRPYTSGLD